MGACPGEHRGCRLPSLTSLAQLCVPARQPGTPAWASRCRAALHRCVCSTPTAPRCAMLRPSVCARCEVKVSELQPGPTRDIWLDVHSHSEWGLVGWLWAGGWVGGRAGDGWTCLHPWRSVQGSPECKAVLCLRLPVALGSPTLRRAASHLLQHQASHSWGLVPCMAQSLLLVCAHNGSVKLLAPRRHTPVCDRALLQARRSRSG